MSEGRSQWSYHVLRPRAVDAGERERIGRAHACWLDTWSAMLRDLDGVELRFDDDFARQDEVGALFCGDECVGVSGYRFVDLSLPWHRRDSYFAAWPQPLLEQIAAVSPRVCIGSNLAVAPSWRGAIRPMRVSEMLLGLAVRRWQESDAQIMVGTMRNDRRMNDISYRMGALPLRTNVLHHHVAVDLVVFTRNIAEEVALPPIRWVHPSSTTEERTHEERIGKLRRTAG
jgi:hypothetical protein